eukprot:SAG11_NODE_24751_length_368_cov_1.539033_1_plen_82_part_10
MIKKLRISAMWRERMWLIIPRYVARTNAVPLRISAMWLHGHSARHGRGVARGGKRSGRCCVGGYNTFNLGGIGVDYQPGSER